METTAEQQTSQEIGPTTVDGRRVEALLNLLERVYKLGDYLHRSMEQGLISQQVAHMAWDAWGKLSAATESTLPVPDACPGPDGQLLYSWEHRDNYLELEIFPDRPAEFFYQNEASGQTWEAIYLIGEPLPADALARLMLFA